MNLATGTKLGPYEIEHSIGKGGMGEVYRALDSRLGRTVAIKILTASGGHQEERLRRFEQEARTVGALNHPNLLTLHDIGRHDNQPYIVTELLMGQTLRRRLSERVEVPEALRIAADIARGLAAAHAKEIVHRDIKPENLFVTIEGRIKILDFGVAKLTDDGKGLADTQEKVDPALQHTDLETARTSTGMVIGTPGYMAPEQLRGEAIDGRTDVFALGVVLYEMVNGKRPFVAETSVEESYAILKLTPAPSSARIPEPVDQLIRRCLEKRPDDRFQSASDLAFALDAIGTAGTRRPVSVIALPAMASPVAVPAPTLETRRPRARWPLVALGVVVAIAGAFWIGRTTQGPAPQVALPSAPSLDPQFRRVTFGNAAPLGGRFVPNERTVVYTRQIDGQLQVVKSQLDQPSIQIVAAGRLLDISSRTELATATGLIGAPGELRRVAMMGGSAPRVVAESVLEAAWAPDAERLAIIRRTPDGDVLEFPVGTPLVRGVGLSQLRMAAKQERIAYVEGGGKSETMGQLVVIDGSGKKLAAIGPHSISGLAWNGEGTEVWFSTVSKDPAANAIRALTVADQRERVVVRTPSFPILHDVALDGRVLFAPLEAQIRLFVARDNASRELSWFDGSVIQGVSADGRTIAFVEGTETGGRDGLYAAFTRVIDGQPVQIGYAARLALLADGSAVIALATDGEGLKRIPTGAGASRSLDRGEIERFDNDDDIEVAARTPIVIYRAAAKGKAMRLWAQALNPDLTAPQASAGPPRPIGPDTLPRGRHPVSPDGAWIAIAVDGGIRLLSTTTQPERTIGGGVAGEQPLAFSADGGALFVIPARGAIRPISRLDLATGKRAAHTTVTFPPGSRGFSTVRMSADGATVAYSGSSSIWDLFVIEQAR